MWSAELSYGDTVLAIGDGSTHGGFNATSDGIEGWYETPDSKWDLTEKSYSHGAYSLFSEDEILYSARTVTLNLYAEGSSRAEVIENALALLGCAGHEVKLSVSDGEEGKVYTSYVTGYATVEEKAGRLSDRYDPMVLTITCSDPYRYGCWTTTEDIDEELQVAAVKTATVENDGEEASTLSVSIAMGVGADAIEVTATMSDGTTETQSAEGVASDGAVTFTFDAEVPVGGSAEVAVLAKAGAEYHSTTSESTEVEALL